MKINEMITFLGGFAEKVIENSCDGIKSGRADRDLKKVAVAMFATPAVIKNAHDWGAEMLIVHEPTYYNHFDVHTDDPLEVEKRKLLEESGITVYRFHDVPHYSARDMIAEGMLETLGLKGKTVFTDTFDLVRVELDEPMSPIAVAKLIEEKCGIKHVRICGERNALCKKLSFLLGAPNGVIDELRDEESEIVLTGEVCEWRDCEYARDSSQLGRKKSLLLLGHIGSEREGMKHLATLLKEKFAELEIEYFDCGEVYTYTD